MSQLKQCFVVMPIRSPGTEEYAHFRAVYNELKLTMQDLNFHCTRADEVSEGGSINNDIIKRIADSDLLIADLTDGNPNVFYEIGIRHTLRSQGTILLIDVNRTKDIPFDLSNYRAIKYKGTLTGIGELREELGKFVSASISRGADFRDSPVHDALPALSPDLIAETRNSNDGRLRVELAEAKLQIDQLKKRFNPEGLQTLLSMPDPQEKLDFFLSQAIANKLPQQIRDACNKAAKEYNLREFIEHASQLCAVEHGHEPRIFSSVAASAGQLGLEYVGVAIYDYAVRIFPYNANLLENRMSYLLTSSDQEVRERARRELQARWEISIDSDGSYIFGKPMPSSDAFLGARYFDSLKSDNMMKESYEYAKAFQKVSNDQRALRTLASSLVDQGKPEEAYTYYKTAVMTGTPYIISTHLRFWAIDLVNNGRFYEAVQIQARGCLSDLDDSVGFGWLVTACNRFRQHTGMNYLDVALSLNQDNIIAIVNCTLSCPSVSATAIRYICEALGINQSQIDTLHTVSFSMDERRSQVEKVQSLFGDKYFDSVEAAHLN